MPGLPPSGRKKRGKRPTEKEPGLDLRVIMNLICILIPVLIVQQVTDYYRHDVELPTKPTSGKATGEENTDEDKPKLPAFNLKLTLLQNSGMEIVNAKTLQPGQNGLVAGGAGVVVPPLPNGMPDYVRMQQVLFEEKKNRIEPGRTPDDYPDPQQVSVVAPEDAPYQKVVSILDYLRFAPTAGTYLDAEADSMFTIITLSPGSVGG